mmetsp:Transcript_17028/g.43646  ORF Transcript_17028/g.43646 Transcript_17028/m.43646 type:complete len:82 (+) Transcript_17028:42-287(+)
MGLTSFWWKCVLPTPHISTHRLSRCSLAAAFGRVGPSSFQARLSSTAAATATVHDIHGRRVIATRGETGMGLEGTVQRPVK